MKKLTLTFCALFAVLAVAPALFADGPEKYSGKEKEVMQPAPPVCEWYRAHEWDLDIWGAFMFSGNSGTNDVPRVDPFSTSVGGGPFTIPDGDITVIDLTAVPPTTTEPAISNPTERVNIGRVSNDQLMGRDNTFGGGLDVKYFWSKYFGAGIEGVGIAAKTNFAGGELGTLTVRYPFGHFAPYGWGGIGAVEGGGTLYRFFNEKTVTPNGNGVEVLGKPAPPEPPGEREFYTTDLVGNKKARPLGQLGVGLEYRITCHIGLMADFSWNFVFGKEGSADKLQTIIESGNDVIIIAPPPVPPITIPVVSKAVNLKPGSGSDNQDFGMARFGVTFSY